MISRTQLGRRTWEQDVGLRLVTRAGSRYSRVQDRGSWRFGDGVGRVWEAAQVGQACPLYQTSRSRGDPDETFGRRDSRASPGEERRTDNRTRAQGGVRGVRGVRGRVLCVGKPKGRKLQESRGELVSGMPVGETRDQLHTHVVNLCERDQTNAGRCSWRIERAEGLPANQSEAAGSKTDVHKPGRGGSVGSGGSPRPREGGREGGGEECCVGQTRNGGYSK